MIALGAFKAYGIAIAAAVLLGSVTLYVANAERNRALIKAYEKETARNLQVIAHQDEQIGALNARIRGNNERWLKLVQEENRRAELAQAEAARIRAERDRVTAALSESRREWQEAVAHDEELAEFVRHDVPGAVWRRLCVAAGSTDCH